MTDKIMTLHPEGKQGVNIDKAKYDVIKAAIIDTAGRLHVDEAMMSEIRDIHATVAPHETLFVVDSMTGQDAANTAKDLAWLLEHASRFDVEVSDSSSRWHEPRSSTRRS